MRILIIIVLWSLFLIGPTSAQENYPPFPWRFVKVAELDSENPSAALSTVWSAGIDGMGNVSLTTSRVLAIHQFRPDGAWRQNLGRKGSGPGEFQGTSYVSVANNGELLVYDGLLNRITHLDQDGSFINSINISSIEVVLKALHVSLAGDFWLSNLKRSITSPDLQFRRLWLQAPEGDTLWSTEYEGATPFLRYETGRGPIVIVPNPAFYDILWDVDSVGNVWLLSPAQDSLTCVTSEGIEALKVSTKLQELELSRETWSTFVNHVVGFVNEFEAAILRRAAEPLEQALNRARSNIRPIQRMWWVDANGLLVDRLPYRHLNSGPEWPFVRGCYAALLNDGRMTAEVDGPGGLVMVANGYALSLQSRTDDLPRLILYRLEPINK